MLLKIFTKKNKKGEYLDKSNPLEYKEWYFEGDEILKKPLYKVGEPELIAGFSFMIKQRGEIISTFDISLWEQGYELSNNQAIPFEKFLSNNIAL